MRWTTAARRLFVDRQLEFWLGELDRCRSLTELRARVVDVVTETRDTRTFLLRPNGHWRGHRAGQYLQVEVEIDGVRHRRCYSISSAPHERLVAITVKAVPGGRVSGWLHRRLRPGDVLTLGAPAGEFVLPEPLPPKLLLVSGGSGVTPTMSILRDLAHQDRLSDVVFVHYARSRADVIFRRPVESLAESHPGLDVALFLDDAPEGGFDPGRLAGRVPDFADRATWLCGPPGLSSRVEQMWARAGASARLRLERFVPPAPSAGDRAVDLEITLARSNRSFAATGAATLLDQLERAGERPASGCRMGICHTCVCRKVHGTVENLLTGAVSSQPDEEIQPCVSVPRSDLTLAL